MRSRSAGLLASGLLLPLLLSAKALSQETPAPRLRLPDVLASLDDTHPVLEAATQQRALAEAERFAADGAWDPLIKIDGQAVPSGYYERAQVAARVEQATPLWGAGLYAGYRIGRGDFPVYKGDYQTLSHGELHAGVKLPLWKDRAIDPRRANIQARDALLDGARCGARASRLQVRRDAAHAYWDWVEAGLALDIQGELRNVATARETSLKQRVELGSAPSILVVDNARLLLEREAKWVGAERDFKRSSLALSLFLRDARRRPVSPNKKRLPGAVPELGRVQHEGDVDQALAARPELCELQAQAAAATVALSLAGNQRAPAVDALAFVARDLGYGPDSLAPTELGVGVHFEMPLTLRKARGKQRAAQVKLSAIHAKLRGLRDRIAAQVQQARVDLDAAHRQVVVARAQKEAADKLAAAERDKLEEGASDLVVLNLREIAAAEAARAELAALVAMHKAHVDYLTATGEGI